MICHVTSIVPVFSTDAKDPNRWSKPCILIKTKPRNRIDA